VVKNISYSPAGVDEKYRELLRQTANEKGNEYLYNLLKQIDPHSAEKIHLSDVKRIIRALEIFHVTGETATEQKRKSLLDGPLYDATIYAIDTDRAELYNRINNRVEDMFNRGLVQEVIRLYKMGVNEKMTSMQGIGYKETMQYIKGLATLEETKTSIARNTRRYAKRQLTWFRKNDNIIWIRRQTKW
jgi:tRNA dimethylallyltransferase